MGRGVRAGAHKILSTEGLYRAAELQTQKCGRGRVSTDVPDPDQTSSSKTPPQSAECRSKSAIVTVSSGRRNSPLMAPLRFQPPHAIIARIGRWQISFHSHTTATRNAVSGALSTKHQQLTSQDTATVTCPLGVQGGTVRQTGSCHLRQHFLKFSVSQG